MDDMIKIDDITLSFQGATITCPMTNGMRMVPVKPICEMIDVQFKNQDSWIKNDPYYGQLYLLAGVVARDGKVRDMNCLPLFDVLGWLSSITKNNRSAGSVEKQYALMAYLRERMLDIYKEVEVIRAENEFEMLLLERKAEVAEEMSVLSEKGKRLQKEMRDIERSLDEVRANRYTNQLLLPFPKGGENN